MEDIFSLSFLIKKVRLHSDERESDYFSDEVVTGEINDAVSMCHALLCQTDSSYFLTSIIVPRKEDGSYELPREVEQLRGVDRQSSDGYFSIIRPTDLVQRQGNFYTDGVYGFLSNYYDNDIEVDEDIKYFVVGDTIMLDTPNRFGNIPALRLWYVPRPARYEKKTDITVSVTGFRSLARDAFIDIAKSHLLQTSAIPAEPVDAADEVLSDAVKAKEAAYLQGLSKEYILQTLAFNGQNGLLSFPTIASQYIYIYAALNLAIIRSTNQELITRLDNRFSAIKQELMMFAKKRVQGTPKEITQVHEGTEFY